MQLYIKIIFKTIVILFLFFIKDCAYFLTTNKITKNEKTTTLSPEFIGKLHYF